MRSRIPALAVVALACVPIVARASSAIDIVSPRKGEIVTSAAILVTGTVVSSSPNVGVTVNDVPGYVDIAHSGTKADPFRWFASVRGAGGEVKLKARLYGAPDTVDNHGGPTVVRQITHSPAASPVLSIAATPGGGIVPLHVRFDTSFDGSPVTNFEADLDGDGTYEITSAAMPETLETTYQSAGLKVASFRVTNNEGSVSVTTVPVLPQTFATMDRLLRAVWNEFVHALSDGDADGSLDWLASDSVRDKYRGPLRLIEKSLPEFAARLGPMHAVQIGGSTAHYLVTRNEDGRTFGYHVYFSRDRLGMWKVVQF